MENMSRSDYSLLGVLAASLFLSLLFCPPFDIGMSDKEVFTYAGWAMHNGLVPYRDFFDHKPPLIYFVNAAGIFLGGRWGIWAIDALLALLTTGLFYRLARRYRMPFPWLLPLLFNLLIRDFLISEAMGLTREYTTFFYLLFFYVLMSEWRYRNYLLGLLTAVIFFMQQEQVFAVLPFLLYVLGRSSRTPVIRRLLFLALGATSVILPLVLYFAAHHALAAFWQDAFLFNMKVYTTQAKSFGDHFRTIKRVLDAGNYEIPFLTALAFGVAALVGRSRRKGLILAALAGLLLTMAPEFMGGRYKDQSHTVDFLYYFLPVSGGICVLLFTVCAFSEDVLTKSRIAWLPYIILLCSSVLYTALQHATHLPRSTDDPVLRSPEVTWLREHRPANGQLYIFSENEDYLFLYYDLRILSPSPWIYQHIWTWYDRWDADGRILHTIGEDLLAHKTNYVIVDPSPNLFRNPANYVWWRSFIQTHYEPVQLPGRTIPLLWQLKVQ
jgi:hypothetical protein